MMPALPTLRLVLWLTVALVALLGAANAGISWHALAAFEDVLLPSYFQETEMIGGAVAAQLGRALEVGVPLDRLVGMDDFLGSFLDLRGEFAYIALTDTANGPLHVVGTGAGAFHAALADGLVGIPDPAGGLPSRVIDLGGLVNVAVPVQTAAGVQAWLNIGVDRGLLDTLVTDTGWDVAIILLVCLIVTVEMLIFVIDRSVSATLRGIDRVGREAAAGSWSVRLRVAAQDEAGQLLSRVDAVLDRINGQWERLCWRAQEVVRLNPATGGRVTRVLDHFRRRYDLGTGPRRTLGTVPSTAVVRTPLFLAIFAEGLSLSFLPVHAATLPLPDWGMDRSFLLGLPITVFMLGIVVATPMGGRLVRLFGTRRIFLAASLPYAAGYLVTALGDSLAELLAGRLLSAVGYALLTIAAQAALTGMVGPERRTRSMAVFVGAVMGATACGAAAGAVVADRFGFDASFLLATGLALLAALVAWRHLPQDMPGTGVEGRADPRPAAGRDGSSLSALTNPRFLALLLLAAIPAKLFLTGVIFYLAPLLLTSLEVSPPAIGRTVMSYALIIVLTVDFSAWVTDRYRLGHAQIVAAGLLTGAGALALLVLDPATGLLVAIACYGVAQSLSAAPLLSVVPDLCPREAALHGPAALFAQVRLFERVGSIAGPMLAAGLTVAVGPVWTVVWIGAVCAAGSVLYGLAAAVGGRATGAAAERQALP